MVEDEDKYAPKPRGGGRATGAPREKKRRGKKRDRPILRSGFPARASKRSSERARCEPRLLEAKAWISSTITIRVVLSMPRPDSEPKRM
jgi:hypothetical protein